VRTRKLLIGGAVVAALLVSAALLLRSGERVHPIAPRIVHASAAQPRGVHRSPAGIARAGALDATAANVSPSAASGTDSSAATSSAALAVSPYQRSFIEPALEVLAELQQHTDFVQEPALANAIELERARLAQAAAGLPAKAHGVER
jgi:hypothetical protein